MGYPGPGQEGLGSWLLLSPQVPEEQWADADAPGAGEGAGEGAGGGGGWAVVDMGGKRSRVGAWTPAEEERRRAGVLREALAAYDAEEGSVAACGTDRARLEALLVEVGSTS